MSYNAFITTKKNLLLQLGMSRCITANTFDADVIDGGTVCVCV